MTPLRLARNLLPALALSMTVVACKGGAEDDDTDVVNAAPIANAGADQQINLGETATLDGSGSADADSDPLTFAWTVATAPAGSAAQIQSPTTVGPTFTPDVAGTYVVQLVVNDGTVDSSPDTVTIAVNAPPTANAGPDWEYALGMRAHLDGTASADPDGGNLTYAWAFTAVPAGSGITAANLDDATSATPRFTADLVGAYTLELTVSDGAASAKDTVTITVSDFVVLTHGRTVSLMRHDQGALVTVGSATIPTAGLLDQNVIFSLIQRGDSPVFYATNLNGPGNEAWWGDAQIHRFVITPQGVTYDGLAFAYNRDTHSSAELSPCSEYTTEFQVGSNAPVNGVFSPDGSRLFITDDCDDVLDIFTVDGATGDLELVFHGARTWLHGLAVHPTEPLIYNGGWVLELDGDTASVVQENWDWTGNFTTFVAPDRLFSTISWTNAIAVFSLTDPRAPELLSAYSLPSNAGRAFALDLARDRLVVVGRNALTTLGFDGSDLTRQGELRVEGRPFVEHRAVALTDRGQLAVTAWFQARTVEDPYDQTGGYQLFTIAADGTPTAGPAIDLNAAARYITPLRLP